MFGSKKNKAKKKAKHSQKIRAEALENMNAARAHIGDETLQKINAIMENMGKEKNPVMAKARSEIEDTDAERVAAEILWMIEDKD